MKYKIKVKSPECFMIHGRNDVRELIVERKCEEEYYQEFVVNCDPANVGIDFRKFYFKDCEKIIAT